MKSRTKAAIIGAVLAAGLGYFSLTTPLGDSLVRASYDLPFKFRPFIFPNEVVMVYLDDASHEKLHQKYTEVWNRAFHAKLVNRLTAEHAKAVVFDLIFSDAMDPATDRAFAGAMEQNGNVVLGAELVTTPFGPRGAVEVMLMRPAATFDHSAADLGLDSVFPDADEEIRTYRPAAKYAGQSTPMSSEAWAGALLADPTLLANHALRDSPFWLNYYGPEMATLPSVSLYQALADSDPKLPRGFFSNKVVFVGERLGAELPANRKDEYGSPYSWMPQNRFFSGVGVHATACLNLIRGDYLRRLDWMSERIIVIALGILFGVGFVFIRPVPAVLTAILSVVLIALVDYLFFVKFHYWFPCLIPMAVQIPIALVWAVASESVQLYGQLLKLQKSQG